MRKKKSTSPARVVHHHQNDPLPSLLAIGAALSSEKEISRLLQLILRHALEITGSEGASICLIERKRVGQSKDGTPVYQKYLRFQQSLNLTRENSLMEKMVPLNEKSIIGYVATTGDTLSIRDCYSINEELPFYFNRTFDQENSYRTKSVLSLPIKTPQGKILGVLQLINKLRPSERQHLQIGSQIPERAIIAFSKEDLNLMNVFASQAAVALDNAKMAQDITNLFKSFVHASVTAIESRDPTTSGHSARVAILTVALAKKVSELKDGKFRDVSFSDAEIQEIRIASLLHDFGKICVKEAVLLKAKKLHDYEIQNIQSRLKLVRALKEASIWKLTFNKILENPKLAERIEDLKRIELEAQAHVDAFHFQVKKLEDYILKANEPQVHSLDFDIQKLMVWIDEIAKELGESILSQDEKRRLSIKRGSLSHDERKQMENHVVESFRFLSRIAWPEQLENVPHIAHGHHEKLDGSGYPLGLKGEEISLPARMMAITDIYDSLVASDRPYKKAVGIERTFEILEMEAKQGKIDPDLLEVFLKYEIYKLTLPTPVNNLKKAN